MNEPLLTVHELAPDHVVVELHESLTPSIGGLELHLGDCLVDGRVEAYGVTP